jgi:tRNA pseudouridine55 synthase
MNGLLIVDKPTGPSSHDVVARVRRVLEERRIGHTGTLDPDASGVLALVVGRATRLAQFLSGDDKSYEAVVRLGASTNTYDSTGRQVGASFGEPLPSREAIDAALDAFRGTFLQQPPAYSAKKVDGHPSYKAARRADRRSPGAALADVGRSPAEVGAADEGGSSSIQLEPVSVTTTAVEVVGVQGDLVTLRVNCSAGFYVRSLAHDLGQRLGTGGHLASLRRTRSGQATIAKAVPLAELEDREHGYERAASAIVAPSQMLPALPAVELTELGVRHATHGRALTPADLVNPVNPVNPSNLSNPANLLNPVNQVFRLLNQRAELVGLARHRASGVLHPFIVLM